jgi:hypothetical protein
VGSAQAQVAPPSASWVPSKADWVIRGFTCPIGCQAGTSSLLKSKTNGDVHFNWVPEAGLDVPFLEHCDGKLLLYGAKSTGDELAQELNRELPDDSRKFSVTDLGVHSIASTSSATAICDDAKGTRRYAHLVVVEPGRILIEFRRALVELR